MTNSTRHGWRRVRRWLAWVGATLTASLAILAGALLISGCAAFGGKPEGDRLARAEKSPQWHDDKFVNPQPMWADLQSAWYRLIFGASPPGAEPDAAVPVVQVSASTFASPPASGLRVTWFGHSFALVEIDGRRIVMDPLTSERTSPVMWAGPKLWYPPPVTLSELPAIDAVVISHDHYDHLDQAAIVALTAGTAKFVVPLGLGAHLARWGVPEEHIIELDWWQSTRIGDMELVATPARHASGRMGRKTDRTLWAGYALIGTKHRVWYSGDTGLHDELPAIGERLGPFDATLIEAGQYDTDWPDIHLGPELAVEAHRQVRGKVLIPVHWGLVKLAVHSWTEPAERVLASAACRQVDVRVPRPGESIEPTRSAKTERWWPASVPWLTGAQSPVIATRNGNPSDRVTMPPC